MTSKFEGAERRGIDTDPSGVAPKFIPPGTPEHHRYDQVRSQYDRALQAARVTATQPQVDCHNVADYRRQLLQDLAPHTQEFARSGGDHSYVRCISDAMLPQMEEKILADALRAPHRAGELREIVHVDRTGRTQTEFIGPKSAWMNPLKPPLTASCIYVNGKRGITPMGF